MPENYRFDFYESGLRVDLIRIMLIPILVVHFAHVQLSCGIFILYSILVLQSWKGPSSFWAIHITGCHTLGYKWLYIHLSDKPEVRRINAEGVQCFDFKINLQRCHCLSTVDGYSYNVNQSSHIAKINEFIFCWIRSFLRSTRNEMKQKSCKFYLR